MTISRLSRSEVLLGAGAASIAGLTGCERGASSTLPGLQSATASGSQFSRVAGPNVAVTTPTGDAIQQAIDNLPPSGGTINLMSSKPYVIKKPLVINNKTNVTLMGRGPLATSLVAKDGAVLHVSGHAEEYVLVVENSSNVTISALTVDTANQSNSSGNPRIGIGVWSSSSVTASTVSFVNNLGANGLNSSLSFNQCQTVLAERCKVSQSRIGISMWKTKGFTVKSSQIEQCASMGPNYPGPVSGISIVQSSGLVTLSYIFENTVDAGVFIKDSEGVRITTTKIAKTMPFNNHGNNGIVIEDCKGTTESHRVHVQRCALTHNSGGGIVVSKSSKVTIGQCTIANNNGAGVTLSGTQDVQLHADHISRLHSADYPGIKAGYSATDSGAYIHDCAVHGLGAGISLGSMSKDCTVAYNDFRFNAQCYVDGGQGNNLSNNLC
ncbi:MAG: right-handed parallel beta-helix repeat-containing protein [Candidatus Cybelea sp.]